MVLLGLWAGRPRKDRGGEGGHYFLAGNTLRWPVIGLAMFAANISTVHLVSLAESACKYGLIYGNFEWTASRALPDPLPAGAGPLVWTSWKEPLQSAPGGHLLSDDRVLSGVVPVVFVVLYVVFR